MAVNLLPCHKGLAEAFPSSYYIYFTICKYAEVRWDTTHSFGFVTRLLKGVNTLFVSPPHRLLTPYFVNFLEVPFACVNLHFSPTHGVINSRLFAGRETLAPLLL